MPRGPDEPGYCRTCKHFKPASEYHGDAERCKACDFELWRARSDKREPRIDYATHDRYGNKLQVNDKGVPLIRTSAGKLTPERAKIMINRAVRTPFLQDIADAGGVSLKTLRDWLERTGEPFESFAIQLREKINLTHRDRLWEDLLLQSAQGETRATIKALEIIDPETFRDAKKHDVVVRRGVDERDLSQLTDAELQVLEGIHQKLPAGDE